MTVKDMGEPSDTQNQDRIEKVARALFAALKGDVHNTEWEFMAGPVNIDEELKERYRKMARAAIAAHDAALIEENETLRRETAELVNSLALAKLRWSQAEAALAAHKEVVKAARGALDIARVALGRARGHLPLYPGFQGVFSIRDCDEACCAVVNARDQLASRLSGETTPPQE